MQWMAKDMTWRVLVIFECLLCCARLSVAADLPESQVRSAAQTFMARIQGAARPPAWDNAAIQSIESITVPQGKWHCCKLATSDRPAGYILMAEGPEQLQPVMYSGTPLDVSFIQQLAFPAGEASSAPGQDWQTARDVILVAPITPQLTDANATTTPVASACAAVLGYLQNVKGYPLFDRIVFHPDKKKRFPRPEMVRMATSAPFDARAIEEMGRRSREQYDAFLREVRKAREEHDLDEYAQVTTTRGPRMVKKHKRPLDEFRIISEIRTGYLRDADPVLREKLIDDEQHLADSLLERVSEGMEDTFMLEYGYWRSGKTIEQVLADFFLSRGFQVRCLAPAVPDLSGDQLPAVLYEPSGNAGVIVGVSSGPTPRWVLVGIPKTVPIIRTTLAEELTQIRKAAGNPPVDPNLPPEVRARAERELSERSASEKEAIILLDACANLPAGLDKGVHVVVQDCLANWKTCVFSLVVAADNWGDIPVTFTERKAP